MSHCAHSSGAACELVPIALRPVVSGGLLIIISNRAGMTPLGELAPIALRPAVSGSLPNAVSPVFQPDHRFSPPPLRPGRRGTHPGESIPGSVPCILPFLLSSALLPVRHSTPARRTGFSAIFIQIPLFFITIVPQTLFRSNAERSNATISSTLRKYACWFLHRSSPKRTPFVRFSFLHARHPQRLLPFLWPHPANAFPYHRKSEALYPTAGTGIPPASRL